MPDVPRYGRAKITTITRDFDRLREAIRSHDSFATEEAWSKCERWLEFAYGQKMPTPLTCEE